MKKIIKTNYVKIYYRLKRTHINILQLDVCKLFERKLNKEDTLILGYKDEEIFLKKQS